ncbi:MAG: rhodanese-like domain-containing protein [Chthoniobacterales bacterium]
MFAAPKITLVTLLTLALISAACRKSTVSPPPSAKQNPSPSLAANSESYTTVTASQLAGMLPTKNFTMINVHIPYAGDIPQTDFIIPFDRIAENLDKLPAKDARLLIYCRSGRMSKEATLTLVRLGYSHVMHLDGGFNAWKAAGNEMVNEP